MSGICDTCKRKPCPAEGEGLRRCDFHKGGESNYERLFGTPERAARTIANISRRVNLDSIGGDYDALLGFDGIGGEFDALLEWLRGESDGE